MFGFGDAQDAHQQVYNQDGQPDNQASFSHEILGGAAAFEGMRMYEKHQRANGEAVDHGTAKEVLAGFAGAEADRLAETHGMNEVDKIRNRENAQNNAGQLYDQQYGNQPNYDPNSMDPAQGTYDQQGNY